MYFRKHNNKQCNFIFHHCPCDVWCRGSTTCLLHVGPPFGNRFLNTSWAVGLTYWIVHLHCFCILTYAIICLDTSYHFWLHLYFLNILYFFKYSCTNIFHRRSLCTFYSITWNWNYAGLWYPLCEKQGLLILHGQYHSCWWLVDARSQAISNHAISLVIPEHILVQHQTR